MVVMERKTLLTVCFSFVERVPMRERRRRESTARNWNTSATDGFMSLFFALGFMCAVPLNCARAAFAESGISKETPPSADTNTAGRTPACSYPEGIAPRSAMTISPGAKVIVYAFWRNGQNLAKKFYPRVAFLWLTHPPLRWSV